MKILITTIPHSTQRYNTPGDWYWESNAPGLELAVRVSDTGAYRYNILIAFHEMIEAILCEEQGIDAEAIDLFDRGEDWKKRGYSEPGEDPMAPYHTQHMFAETLERFLALELGVDWRAYGEALERLEYHPEIEDPQNERPAIWSRPWNWVRGGQSPSICSVCGVEEGKPHIPDRHRVTA